MANIENILTKKAGIIDDYILKLVDNHTPRELREPIVYLIKAGGKRIRPIITLLCSEALDAKENSAIGPAVSIELAHTASLIHDDLIDNSRRRRGEKTVQFIWGPKIAILAGDILLSLTIKSLLMDPKKFGTKQENLGAMGYFFQNINNFADAWVTLCIGENIDIHKNLVGLKEEEVLDLIYKKTAILFELAALSGAIYAGAKKPVANKLANYGRNVGMAFQIQDDILGVFGNEKILGKDVGSDIKEGKKTLLVSYVLNEGTQGDKKKLLRSLGNSKLTKEDLEDVKDLLSKSGALDYAKSFAHRFSDAAVEQLGVLEDSKAKQHLKEIPSYVVSRLK